MPDLIDDHDIDRLVTRVAGWRPGDLAERCAGASGLGADDFRHPAGSFDGRICAVDGSNTTLLRTGSAHWVAARAGASIFSGNRPAGQKITPLRVVQVGVNRESPEFEDLFCDCFGEPPTSPLRGEDYQQGGSVIRDTIEYWAIRELIRELAAGDLLCIDGALRVSHAAHLPVMDTVITEAAARGVGIVAVSKQTSATWDGGYPLIPAISALASREGVRAPWYVKIPQGFLDQRVHEEWRRGETCVARLHPRARMAFKIEVPAGATETAIDRTVSACAACAGDGRLPGYPFPLMDAHLLATITAAATDDLLGRIIARMGAAGIDQTTFHEVFGDIHDEFARY
ncbi:MAG: DNA double-strand break repair nuclease NurA [Methanomicrobiales archaeon]